MDTANIIQFVFSLLTIVGLYVALCYNNKQLKLLKKQMELNFFSDYTKRYQEIMLNFPENINRTDFDFEKLSIEVKNKTLRYMRAYFDLCNEEYDLYNDKLIDDKIWKIWESGIKYAFSKSAFKKGWEIIKLDTIYYSDFQNWIDNEVINKNEK